VNNVKTKVYNQLVNSHKQIRELSTNVAQINHDNEGSWCGTVKKQVDVSLEKAATFVRMFEETTSSQYALCNREAEKMRCVIVDISDLFVLCSNPL